MSQIQRYRTNVLYEDPAAPGPGKANGPQGASDQLEQVLDILRRGKWIILATLLVALGVSGALVYTQEPDYRATSLVMLTNNQSGTTTTNQGLQLVNPNSQWGRSADSELLLLRNSQQLPRRVAERIQALSAGRSGVGSLVTTETGDTLNQDALAGRVRSAIQFGANNSLIQIQAVTPDARHAPLLANLFAEEYVGFTQEISRASLVASRRFLERQLAEQEEELNRIERRIENSLKAKQTTSIEAEGSALLSRISALEGRQDQIDIEIERREATIEALRQNLEEIRPQLAASMESTTSQEIEMAQEKLAELKAERQVALLNNPEWDDQADPPALRRLNRQIEMLEETLSDLSEEYVATAISAEGTRADSSLASEGLNRAVALKQQIASEQIALTGLRTERAAIAEQTQRYQAELESVPGESIQMQKLERDRQRVAQMYDFITQRLQEIQIKEQGEQGYATMIAEATAVSSTQPGRDRTLLLGAFLGLMLGIGLSVVRYKFDNRIVKPDQLEDMGFDTAVVPDMKTVKAKQDGRALVERDGQEVPVSLVTVHDASSYATEAFRQLRTNVQFGFPADRSNVLLVTSPGVGEGKSTTSANLAVSFAKAGYRTVLLDADLRRPQVHNLMGRSLEPGLYQYLTGEAGFEPSQAVTHVDNLHAITAGRATGGDAAEVTGGQRMREFLDHLREHFDLIIVDTPPALAVAEARQIAPKSDATLVVVKAGATRENELNFTVQQLERVGARIMGVVLNGVDLESASYGYGYRYAHYAPYEQAEE